MFYGLLGCRNGKDYFLYNDGNGSADVWRAHFAERKCRSLGGFFGTVTYLIRIMNFAPDIQVEALCRYLRRTCAIRRSLVACSKWLTKKVDSIKFVI